MTQTRETLTRPQRELLSRLADGREWTPRGRGGHNRMANALVRRGLICRRWRGAGVYAYFVYVITEAGREVLDA